MNQIEFHISAAPDFLPFDFIFTKWIIFSFFYNGKICISEKHFHLLPGKQIIFQLHLHSPDAGNHKKFRRSHAFLHCGDDLQKY